MRSIVVAMIPLALCAGVPADAEPAYDLVCTATHGIECQGASCSSEAAEKGDSIFVGLSIATASGVGNLCTYTYCRDFMLVPQPGNTLEQAVSEWTGFTLSTKRGSTGEDLYSPSFDYQLSISEDRKAFFLGNLGNGGFVGWAGTCTRHEG